MSFCTDVILLIGIVEGTEANSKRRCNFDFEPLLGATPIETVGATYAFNELERETGANWVPTAAEDGRDITEPAECD